MTVMLSIPCQSAELDFYESRAIYFWRLPSSGVWGEHVTCMSHLVGDTPIAETPIQEVAGQLCLKVDEPAWGLPRGLKVVKDPYYDSINEEYWEDNSASAPLWPTDFQIIANVNVVSHEDDFPIVLCSASPTSNSIVKAGLKVSDGGVNGINLLIQADNLHVISVAYDFPAGTSYDLNTWHTYKWKLSRSTQTFALCVDGIEIISGDYTQAPYWGNLVSGDSIIMPTPSPNIQIGGAYSVFDRYQTSPAGAGLAIANIQILDHTEDGPGGAIDLTSVSDIFWNFTASNIERIGEGIPVQLETGRLNMASNVLRKRFHSLSVSAKSTGAKLEVNLLLNADKEPQRTAIDLGSSRLASDLAAANALIWDRGNWDTYAWADNILYTFVAHKRFPSHCKAIKTKFALLSDHAQDTALSALKLYYIPLHGAH